MIRQVRLTEEQKNSLKEIYDKIIHVKFRWGGHGYVKVSLGIRVSWLRLSLKFRHFGPV